MTRICIKHTNSIQKIFLRFRFNSAPNSGSICLTRMWKNGHKAVIKCFGGSSSSKVRQWRDCFSNKLQFRHCVKLLFLSASCTIPSCGAFGHFVCDMNVSFSCWMQKSKTLRTRSNENIAIGRSPFNRKIRFDKCLYQIKSYLVANLRYGGEFTILLFAFSRLELIYEL